MSVPLLTTKLYVPPARLERVPRLRLIRRMDKGLRLGHRLTLVSAPAGFGKTTLLSDWIGQHEGPVAWLSLDDQDNEPPRFWAHLIAALQRVHPDLGQDTLHLLQAAQPPPTQGILNPLLNEIAALAQTPPTTDIVLVLDDHHLVSAPQLHEGIAFLLEHQPHNLHLVISTRADPPLPVFRLRARGYLTELRTDDLRFAPGEATSFLNTVMGLDLTLADVEALETRTEGWIVGLQLAALSLQGRTDARQFIAAFNGSHHYVPEYLTEEVVRRQTEPVRRFLVGTSVLDRLCGSLCDALTGERDGVTTLADLQRRNLFVVPLDDEHRWYRYHHLFADLLGNLLRQERLPERIRELHLRASEWHERSGNLDDPARAASRRFRAGGILDRAGSANHYRPRPVDDLHPLVGSPARRPAARPAVPAPLSGLGAESGRADRRR
jgi:LuxR family maltose regulon positive regulatory protein